jgi:hypothetical protein
LISYPVLRWERESCYYDLCLESVGTETFPLIQVSIKTRGCLVRFSENQIPYDLFSFCKSIEDEPSAIYEQSTQNHASWPFPPLMALVCASIHLIEDPSGSVSCTCSSGFSIVCGCGLTIASWSHDHTACPVEQGASGSPPSRGLHSEVRQVFELPAYVSCRDVGGMRNFPSPDVLEFKFCLVRLHIGTRKAVLLSLCDLA